MFEAAAAQHALIPRAVLFVGLLVERAQSLHHIVEQNRLLPAWNAAQMRGRLRRARVRRPRSKNCAFFVKGQIGIVDDVGWMLKGLGGM